MKVRKRNHEASRTYHEPCCWSEPDFARCESELKIDYEGAKPNAQLNNDENLCQ